MGSITRESIEQLRQKVDLVDLLSSYIELKRNGAYYKACCPFHDEKTPSFVVQPGSNFYHCFGCQAHGDAIAFLMEYQKLTFIEAVEFLAQKYQVLLEYDQQEAPQQSKKPLLKALTLSQQFFHQTLLKGVDKESALSYLQSRGISKAFIHKFGIGLAPRERRELVAFLKKQQVSIEDMRSAGLVNQYDTSFFYERITFPIHDARGQVVGFSARNYLDGSTGGKYINSKESFLFKKSNILYGLNYSRMRVAKGKKVLIVEGQIDALKLIDLGLNATVAPLGTALTENQVDKLFQLGVEQAFLAFDSDEAGLSAALKSGHLLQKKKITTYIVTLPKGSDPDSYLAKNGAKAFGKLLAQKIDYLSFMIKCLSKNTDLTDPAQKSRLIEKIVQKIKEWQDPVMVHESLKKFSMQMQLPFEMFDIENWQLSQSSFSSTKKEKNEVCSEQRFLELDVLVWLLQRDLPTDELLRIAKLNLPEELFEDQECSKIYEVLIKGIKEDQRIDNLQLLTAIPGERTQKLLASLLEKKIHKDNAKELFIYSLQRLLDYHWLKNRERIKEQIQRGVMSEEEALQLAKEFDEMQKKRPIVKT